MHFMGRQYRWLRYQWAYHSRRILFITVVLLVILAAAGGEFIIYGKYVASHTPPRDANWICQHAAEAAQPSVAENSCPGTTDWQIDHPLGEQNAIEGFTVPASVNLGEKVALYVSTTAASYQFQVYRMGWYQGLGGHLVYSSPKLTGIKQPAPRVDPETNMVSCTNWQKPVTVDVPTSWVSGIYIIKLLSSDGFMRYTSFVVRNDTSHATILFQSSVITYQAYNTWGGSDLYRGLNDQQQLVPESRSYAVSFDRPIDIRNGLGDFVEYSELSLLRWLERSGYDVSYSTDVDTDIRGNLLQQHRLYLAAGHDEYWSTAMRAQVMQARSQGVSLAFFGANDIYWHIVLQDSSFGRDREVICYKTSYYPGSKPDPFALTNPQESGVRWRDPPLNEPEGLVLGQMYGGALDGANVPLVIDKAASKFLAGTSLHAGSALPGLIGGEYDRVSDTVVPRQDVTVLASSPLQCAKTSLCPASGQDIANAILYNFSSKAKVFDAGTFYWGWGLDDGVFDKKSPHQYSNPDFQKFTANILTYLIA